MNVARMLSGSMSADFDRDQLLNIFVAEAGDDMKRFWEALHPKGKTHPEPQEVAEFPHLSQTRGRRCCMDLRALADWGHCSRIR